MASFKLDDLRRELAREPQRAARWVHDHLPDVPRLAEHGRRDAVEWVQAHLPSRRDLRRGVPEPASLLWPTVLAAAGAGAAFWWWTSWSRGRAEAERDAQGGAEGAAHPEAVMAHTPPPSDISPPQDFESTALDVAAERVLAHSPVEGSAPGEPAAGGGGVLGKVKAVVAPRAQEALRRNLAVQASSEEPSLKPGGSARGIKAGA